MKNLLYLCLLTILFSCQKDAPDLENEEELITTLNYSLTAADGSKALLTFKDLDGDGGNPPVITAQPLKVNTAYDGAIILLNETVSPAENISDEVNNEKEDHQFFISSAIPGLKIVYNDADKNSRPVGLKTKLTTTTAGNGKLRITLRHLPNKSAMNVAAGDIANAGGETDIQVEFDVTVR